MDFNKSKSNSILRITIILSIFFVILIYFIYRPINWPLGSEAAGCLVALVMLASTAYLLSTRKEKFITTLQKRNVAVGLCFGLLWTIEISINNFIRPGLPMRDDIDNIFFSMVAFLIFLNAARDTFLTNNFSDGIRSGFWSGISSGAIACITALVLIVFGMKYIMLDPLNLKEWTDINGTSNLSGMETYFAYQTFTGAIMHLFILGGLMGLFLGSMAGLTGKILVIIIRINRR